MINLLKCWYFYQKLCLSVNTSFSKEFEFQKSYCTICSVLSHIHKYICIFYICIYNIYPFQPYLYVCVYMYVYICIYIVLIFCTWNCKVDGLSWLTFILVQEVFWFICPWYIFNRVLLWSLLKNIFLNYRKLKFTLKRQTQTLRNKYLSKR